MTTIEKLNLELESALGDWDFHIDRCPECMAEGVHLCDDGEEITNRVAMARTKLATAELAQDAGEPLGPTSWLHRVHLPEVTQRAR
ncbi:MAG: hypothetical protein ACLPZM_04335 [Thermoplasmata archaeon]